MQHNKLWINVKNLKRYNVIILGLSFIFFFIQIFLSGNLWYLIFFIIGGILLFMSGYITYTESFQELFVSNPQRISLLKSNSENKNYFRVEIFPHILDKSEFKKYIWKMEFNVSANYKILKLAVNGIELVNYKVNSNSNIIYDINDIYSSDIKFSLEIYENKAVDVNDKFIEYTIYYSHRKNSLLLNFKEKHILN
jgi:hypothetical protein